MPARSHDTRALRDALKAMPVSTLPDPRPLRRVVVTALETERLRRVWQHQGRGAWQRLEDHARRGELKGRDLFKPAALEQLLTPLFEPSPTAAKWWDEALNDEVLEELLRPVLQATLMAFARQMPGVGTLFGEDAQGARLRHKMSERVGAAAGRWAGMGKALAGTIGFGVEDKVRALIQSLSASLFRTAMDALGERLASAEGRRLLGELRQYIVHTLLNAPLAQVLADIRPDVDRAAMEGLAPMLSALVKELERLGILEAELKAAHAAAGSETLGDLLGIDRIPPAVDAWLDEALGRWLALAGEQANDA